jgi:hypothetical protein
MTIVALALALITRVEVGSGYGRVLPALVVLGLGIGVTMAPMSTAAMNAVSATKAGVASGMLAMSRMVGGTFGVAALGALLQHLTADRLASGADSKDAFVYAFSRSMWLCAAVALTGALVAWALIAHGSVTRTVVPAPGELVTASVPPAVSTRSSLEANPM